MSITEAPAEGPMAWTDVRVDMLVKLREEGDLKRGEMADWINKETGSKFTRSAISGKIDRLFLTAAKPTMTPEEKATAIRVRADKWNKIRREQRAAAGKPAPRPVKAWKQLQVLQPEDDFDRRVYGVSALEDHHCRFILNTDSAAPVYCGKTKVKGHSYCGNCCSIVYAPPRERSAA